MKKTIFIIIGILFLSSLNISIVQAGACDVISDPNGYCDEVGSYSDPSLATIKNNNCSSYTKKINRFCTSYCREDAKTFFPKDVPYVSVDKYDAILGGNHFKWEEIKIETTQECETVIDYNKWQREYNTAISGTDTSLSTIIRHIVREEHQRFTDVSACDFLAYYKGKETAKLGILTSKVSSSKGYGQYKNEVGTGTYKYSYVTREYYRTLSSTKKMEFYMVLTFGLPSINENNCDLCNATTKSVAKNAQVVVDDRVQNWGECPDTLESAAGITPDRKKSADRKISDINKAYGINSKIEDYGFVSSTPGDVLGEFNVNKTCTYGICVTSDGRIRKPNSDGKCLFGEPFHAYNAVLFENVENLTGATSSNVKRYCGQPTYNTTEFDLDNSDVSEAAGSYAVSWNKIKNEVKSLITSLKQCNNSNIDKSNTTSVVVNYKDPTGVYSKNVNLNKKTVSTTDTGLQKTQVANASAGMNWTECINWTKNDINNLIKQSLTTGNMPSVICPVSKRVYDDSGDYLPKYMNTRTYQKITNSYKFEMPEQTYRYILKGTGEAVDSNSTKVTSDIKQNYRYIDIGYPNYPVHYTTPTGTYPISLTYKNLGRNNHLVKTSTYSCEYKVINRVLPCTGKDCDEPNCTGDKCDRKYEDGIDVIYRPISLINPFPGESGDGRTQGENWTATDIAKYITKNRGVTENEVYNKTPLYSFTLDSASIKRIKNYNNGVDKSTGKKRDYSDFNLKCNSKYGKRCISSFIRDANMFASKPTGTCITSDQSKFYSCADKTNQDNIKCYLDKNKKTKCIDCSDSANKNNDICKGNS